MRTHEHVARVQAARKELGARLGRVDAAERGLGQRVGRHERQAVDAHVVDAVDGLEDARHPLEALLLAAVGPLLRHDYQPLVPKHLHAEDRDPKCKRAIRGALKF